MIGKKQETQYERTAFSWMRTTALAILVTIYYLKADHLQSNLAFYLAALYLILLFLSYNYKNKLLLCSTLITLIMSYLCL